MITTQSKAALQQTLSNEEAFATSLMAIVLNEYGTEVFDWDPESLWMALAEDFGVSLRRVNKDKIQAMLLVYTSDLPFVSVEAFNNVCNVFGDSEANFARWDLLSPEECIWGVYEMMLNVGIDRRPNEPAPEYSHEVRRYIGVILENDGIFDPPDILRIAEMEPRAGLDQWQDDQTMFNAAYDKSQTEKARLIEFLVHRLLTLLEELNQLPIVDPETWEPFHKSVTASAQRMVKEHRSAVGARS